MKDDLQRLKLRSAREKEDQSMNVNINLPAYIVLAQGFNYSVKT